MWGAPGLTEDAVWWLFLIPRCRGRVCIRELFGSRKRMFQQWRGVWRMIMLGRRWDPAHGLV